MLGLLRLIGPVAAFGLGLVLAGPASGVIGYRIGHWLGFDAGQAEADKTAELNKAREDLALVRQDLVVAQEAGASALASSETNAAAAATAEERIRTYARELAERPTACACGLSPGDVDRMRPNAWDLRRGPGRAHPPPGR